MLIPATPPSSKAVPSARAVTFLILVGLVIGPAACKDKTGKRDRKGTTTGPEQTVASKAKAKARIEKKKRPLRRIGPKPQPPLRQTPGWTMNNGGDDSKLLATGNALWKDTKLGKSGMSCQMCHSSPARFRPSFAKDYPHPVAMAMRTLKIPVVTAAEMVQVCMTQTMSARRLPWNSPKLHALTRAVLERQLQYRKLSSGEREKQGMKPVLGHDDEPDKGVPKGNEGNKG